MSASSSLISGFEGNNNEGHKRGSGYRHSEWMLRHSKRRWMTLSFGPAMMMTGSVAGRMCLRIGSIAWILWQIKANPLRWTRTNEVVCMSLVAFNTSLLGYHASGYINCENQWMLPTVCIALSQLMRISVSAHHVQQR